MKPEQMYSIASRGFYATCEGARQSAISAPGSQIRLVSAEPWAAQNLTRQAGHRGCSPRSFSVQDLAGKLRNVMRAMKLASTLVRLLTPLGRICQY